MAGAVCVKTAQVYSRDFVFVLRSAVCLDSAKE